MDTQYNKEKYGGAIFRPSVLPRKVNAGITTPNFTLKCKGMFGTKVLEDEMYMSEIFFISNDLGMKWFEFPLDHHPTLNIFWEYGECYPFTRYFDVRPPEDTSNRELTNFLRELSECHDAVMYFNPARHSMMLFVVDTSFGEGGADSMQQLCVGSSASTVLADGGPAWHPRIRLAHEFSLLPAGLQRCKESGGNEPTMMHSQRVERALRKMAVADRDFFFFVDDEDYEEGTSNFMHSTSFVQPLSTQMEGEDAGSMWGGVTGGCTSVQDMQCKLFALGFGPLPYFRRPGVVLLISPDESEDDSPERYMLGVVVAHSHANTRGRCKNCAAVDHGEDEDMEERDDDQDETVKRGPCYMCCSYPFVQVRCLFFSGVLPCALHISTESVTHITNPKQVIFHISTESVTHITNLKQVLFHNPNSAYSDADAREKAMQRDEWTTVPVSSRRAAFRALAVGTRLVVSVGALAAGAMPGAFSAAKQVQMDVHHVHICIQVHANNKCLVFARRATSSNAPGSNSRGEASDEKEV